MSTFFYVKDLKLTRGVISIYLPELKISNGEIHLLMGPSGSGKSSILQALSGFIGNQGGIFQVDGKNLMSLPPESRQIGYVFQQSALFPHLNLWENVSFALKIQGMGKEDCKKQALLWLDKVGLKDHADKNIDQISGGEAQRVQLARALIAGFKVLFLDEPFSALDVALKSDLRKLLKNLVKETGVACLMVSHDPEDLKILADSYSLIENGILKKSEQIRSV